MTDEDAKAFITQVAPLGTMDYSLLQKRPPYNRYKLWVFLASSSGNPGDRDSGNNTADSWSGTWLLCVSDEKNLQLGNGDNQENN